MMRRIRGLVIRCSAGQGFMFCKRSAGQGFMFCKRSAGQGFTFTRRSAQQGFTSLSRSAQQGFTLLEMLVALAVFSLAALALVRLQAVAVRTTADLGERQVARLVVHNLMVDLQTSADVLAPGQEEGDVQNAGQSWHWVRRVSRTDEEGLLRIDIRLNDQAGGASGAAVSFLRENPS